MAFPVPLWSHQLYLSSLWLLGQHICLLTQPSIYWWSPGWRFGGIHLPERLILKWLFPSLPSNSCSNNTISSQLFLLISSVTHSWLSTTWLSSEARHYGSQNKQEMVSALMDFVFIQNMLKKRNPVGLPLIFQHLFDSFNLHLPANIEAMCLQERTKTFSRCSCQFWRQSYFYPIWTYFSWLIQEAVSRSS